MMNKFFLYENLLQKTEIYYKQRKYDLALFIVNKAISMDLPLAKPKKAEAYELRGNIKLQINGHLDSINDFNKAIRLDPKNASLFFYRGMALCVLDDKDGALKDFKQLIKLEPNNNIAKEMSQYLEDSFKE
tara:strand:- start:108 stop:500 length:393 start_codon:yes stop_codon:yes gene_type:complete